MFVILLNGPPRSGKDTFGEELVRTLGSARAFKFSAPIKDGTHASFGLKVPTDHFELVKDQPRTEFLGYTPRQAYINHSEKYMKPVYGVDVFGRLLVEHLDHFKKKNRFQYAVITDSGFSYEAQPLCEFVGRHNMLLVRLYKDGCDYSKDSRDYISLPDVKATRVDNDGDLYHWRQTAVDFAMRLRAGKL